ncbi:Run and tbc1 domain containing 3 [Hibiscus syriacus]|uniref:Run and tbc1 domain containing 3 n=1 Tax=Hibiscus syriacus TaxID=106335 RepID=A0A6A3CQ65_HIBSY|nr:Run and tbc1 domain containing 3 [Hibiscus syriacus]
MWNEFNVKQKKAMGSYIIAGYVHNNVVRDAYGFTVRPQNIQTYREYVNIYKEEEAERLEKWRIFLELHAKHTEQCPSEEEDSKTLQGEAPVVKYRGFLQEENKETLTAEACEANELASIEANEETASKKQHEVTLQTEGTQFNKDAALEEECKVMLQGEAIKVKEEVDSPEKSKDTSETEAIKIEEDGASERSKEGDVPSVKHDSASSIESVRKKPHTAGSSKSETGKRSFVYSMENAREKEVQLIEETKTRKVHRWAKTRPALCAIENLMSSKVKRKNMNGTRCHLPSRKEGRLSEGESQDKFEGKVCVHEISAREGSITDNGDYDESFFPWKEELQSLVHGGVPKDLRGEVWQAFVGVKARRVERYYDELLAKENHDADQLSNSSGVFAKWRNQIEKDIPRTFPGHPALNDHGRDSLRRLLLAYARHNPSVGYCQIYCHFEVQTICWHITPAQLTFIEAKFLRKFQVPLL